MSPALQVLSSSPQLSSRSSISPLLSLNGRSFPSKGSLRYPKAAFSHSRVLPYPYLSEFAVVKASASDEGVSGQISSGQQISLVEDGAEAADDIGDEEKHQQEMKEKADKILQDAINNFAQSDIEDAAKKYDMEDELFAEIDFAQINAFTDRPFAGNPAAVCYLPLKRSDQWLQLVAREFNLSETAFLMKRNTKRRKSPVLKMSPEEQLAEKNTVLVDEFDLRWFTPKVEVDLCGHATLASAHLLFSSGIAAGDTILFHTKSGVMKARKVAGYDKDKVTEEEGESEDLKTEKKRPIGVGVVELDFPLDSVTKCDDTEVEVVSGVLGGAKLLWVGKTGLGDYLAEVASSKELEHLQPQFSSMLNLPGRGLIATARAEENSGLDFLSRFFAPKAGILEDPVTGSAHCSLGPFWAERFGKSSLKAYQASERGGKIDVRVDTNAGRVYLQGSAVLVMAGILLNTSHLQR